MFSHGQFFGHFCIPNIYQTYTKDTPNSNLKNHIPTHIPNEILKSKTFEAHLLYFKMYRSNIKITNSINYVIQF